jgi:hypothetical protein
MQGIASAVDYLHIVRHCDLDRKLAEPRPRFASTEMRLFPNILGGAICNSHAVMALETNLWIV